MSLILNQDKCDHKYISVLKDYKTKQIRQCMICAKIIKVNKVKEEK